jgi:hypothetical protein
MQTAKEYREQLEWFWLFCQEEAWQEEQPVRAMYQLMERTTSGPSGGDGRYYHSDMVVDTFKSWEEAMAMADQLNISARENQYYSIRKVEN